MHSVCTVGLLRGTFANLRLVTELSVIVLVQREERDSRFLMWKAEK